MNENNNNNFFVKTIASTVISLAVFFGILGIVMPNSVVAGEASDNYSHVETIAEDGKEFSVYESKPVSVSTGVENQEQVLGTAHKKVVEDTTNANNMNEFDVAENNVDLNESIDTEEYVSSGEENTISLDSGNENDSVNEITNTEEYLSTVEDTSIDNQQTNYELIKTYENDGYFLVEDRYDSNDGLHYYIFETEEAEEEIMIDANGNEQMSGLGTAQLVIAE